MLKFFRIPFGQSGSRTAVPDAADPSGFVSYTEGYGADYQRQKTDPLSKNIERDKMNEVLFDITTGIAEIQSKGFPDFISTALNGGSPYSYPINAIVRYTDTFLYRSMVAANTTLPTDETKWERIDGAWVTTIYGDGVTDVSAKINAATALGFPIRFKGVAVCSGVTITVPIMDTIARIFTDASTVTINNGMPLRPEWFGSTSGSIRRMVNAMSSQGGVGLFRVAVYPPSYDTFTGSGSDVPGVDYLAKPGVTFIATQAAMNANSQSYIAGSGTIIQGPFAVFADGYQVLGGLAHDSSSAVVTALYGGVAKDAFLFAQPNKITPTYKSGVYIQSVSGICNAPASAVHAVLLEAINGGYVGYAEGANAFHGVVCKSQALMGGTWRGRRCGGEQVIFKSESYAVMAGVEVANVACIGAGSGTSQWGCLVQALAAGARLQIGNLMAEQCSAGLQMSGTVASLSDIQIANVITESCLSGVVIDGVQRAEIGSLIANNSTNAVAVTAATTSKTNRIGSVKATNTSGDVFNVAGQLRVGDVDATSVTGFVYNYVNSSARILLSGIDSLPGVAAANYWNLSTTRINGWIDFGSGNSAYIIRMREGRIWLKGLIKSGSAGIIANISAQITPNENLRLTGMAYNGSVYAAAEIVVGSGSTLACTNFAAGSSYISIDGLSYDIPF